MTKRSYSFIAFFLFLSTAITAQNSFIFSGRITDQKSGLPLAGATIYLTDDKAGTATDSTGNFILRNIKPGHHVVEISFTGYASLAEHIEVNGNINRAFALSPLVIENQGVVVTGVAGATSIRKMPIPVTSVRKAALLQTASTNIIDALTHVPGVSQLSTGPAISKPFIRGLGYNRVLVMNDGVRQEGQQWGDEHGIELDEMSVSRAEVLKGPASLIYGSDAIAGVINFITNVPAADGTTKGNIVTNYQSNNGLFAINGNVTGNKNGFNWNLYGTYKSAGDYRNKYDGRVLNSRFNEKNAGGYIGINKSWGYSHLIFSRFDQHLGLIEGDRDPATGQFILYSGTPLERIATTADLDSRQMITPYQRVQHNKIVSDNSFSAGKSRLKLNLAYQQNLRQEFGNPDNPSETALYFALRTFNYNLQWQLPEIKEWHTTIGINGMQQQNQNKGTETIIPEYRLFDIGGFVYTQRLFKKTTLSGGLRLDNRSVHADGLNDGGIPKFIQFNKSFTNLSGSIGVSHETSDKVTLKANIARGFRAPTLAELASNGAHEGTNRYEYGDTKLKSETSLQADAGAELNTEHISLNVTAFYNRMNHFIFYSKLRSFTGADSMVDNNGSLIPAFQFSQHNASLAGAELSMDIHPHPLDWLHLENNVSFVRGKFDAAVDGTQNLPLIPAARWRSEIKTAFKKTGKLFHDLYAKIEMDKTFRQDKPFTGFDTETATAGYTLWNAGAGTDIINRKKKTLFSLYLAVLNITDKAYQNHLSRLKYTAENMATGRTGVFNAGRNFSVKISVPLNMGSK